jgi:hypothetical protein
VSIPHAAISPSTRLALAFGLFGAACGAIWLLIDEHTLDDASELAMAVAFAAALGTLLGYLAAAYLWVVAWIHDAFRARRRTYLLRHLRAAGTACALAAAAIFAAAYFRYEMVPTGMSGRVHYYLVRDRWTGEVWVDAQLRARPPARNWRADRREDL